MAHFVASIWFILYLCIGEMLKGLGDLPMLLFTIFVWSKFCPVNWRDMWVSTHAKKCNSTHMKLIYMALVCCVWKMRVICRKTIDINRQLLLQYRKPKIFQSFLAYHKWAQATWYIMLVAQLGYEEFLSSFHTPFGVSGKYFIEKCLILWLTNSSFWTTMILYIGSPAGPAKFSFLNISELHEWGKPGMTGTIR